MTPCHPSCSIPFNNSCKRPSRIWKAGRVHMPCFMPIVADVVFVVVPSVHDSRNCLPTNLQGPSSFHFIEEENGALTRASLEKKRCAAASKDRYGHHLSLVVIKWERKSAPIAWNQRGIKPARPEMKLTQCIFDNCHWSTLFNSSSKSPSQLFLTVFFVK